MAKYYQWQFGAVLLVVVCVLTAPLSVRAQDDWVDSVHLELLQAEEAHQIVLFQSLAEYYHPRQPDSSASYVQRMIGMAKGFTDPAAAAEAWRMVSSTYIQRKQIKEASDYARLALKQLESCTSPSCLEEKYEAASGLNYCLTRQGKHREAVDVLLSLQAFEKELGKEKRAMLCLRLGESLNEIGDYDAALAQLNKGLAYGRELEDRNTEQEILAIISITYYYLGDLDKSIRIAKTSRAIASELQSKNAECYLLYIIADTYGSLGRYDSATHYFEQLREESLTLNDSDYYGFAVGGLFRTVLLQGNDNLEEYARAAKEILESGKTYQQLHVKRNIYSSFSNYYLQKGDYQKAEEYALRHVRHVRKFEADTTELVIFALGELSRVQAAIGSFEKAWHTYDTFYQLKMAIVDNNQHRALAQTAVEMDLAENELARQVAEKTARLEQQTTAIRTRFFLVSLTVAAIVLVGLLWAYRRAQRDRQVIKQKNEQIETSLAEKEVLLREIHHRVKNNLQIITGLLDKQARKSSDVAVRKLVKEGQERIQSMALIHQNLYESDQLSGIDIKSYLQELSQNIQRSQAVSPEQIQLNLDVDTENLDIDTAIPVGLILNELLTNSYKYAFPAQRKGSIKVDFKKNKDRYLLQVSDDGVGFILEEGGNKTKSLGLSLVNGLVRQLSGTIEWLAVERGTMVSIQF
ncbi:MAG: tetratricopeptide repeat-containing sensor histidine kinase [Lewinella sp.]|uniref:tetratricopeptide repeat-containing sensor histidine kinase n=1 Tax=Lewinella sp. TaxID=2004506 RepID=UPI003D6AF832